jgi:phosphotransferase system, enzyme I, PtsP
MPETTETDSRRLLRRLRAALAEGGGGQGRLDRITGLIAEQMGTDVCSIYLMRDRDTLELCATRGLNAAAVHQTRMRVGEGLVGRIAREARPLNTGEAPRTRGFRYMPETGEEVYSAFLGVPIQRLGETLGVLVVQSSDARPYSGDAVYALEVVAMVLAEMAELGAFVGEGEALRAPHKRPALIRGTAAQEGVAIGHAFLHEPRVVVTNPIADDPEREQQRLAEAMAALRGHVDGLLSTAEGGETGESAAAAEHMAVLETYRMFAHSRGWMRRMAADIDRGLSAEAAVEKEQSAARARLDRVQDGYLRERLHDLDDLSNRLLRLLTGQGADTGTMPEAAILIARNIGPGDLLDYGRRLRGVVLEEGSVGSHAAIVARALGIPLVVHAGRIVAEALSGDPVIVDGDQGVVHLRPEDTVRAAYDDKLAMQAKAARRYESLRDEPALTRDGVRVALLMNAGLMADLPSLDGSGAEGVGLFRTELQFLIRNAMPRRAELAAQYARVMDAAGGLPVAFRTLDIGSDKVLPYIKPADEPNPALGWRAIRVGLDKPGIMRMQLQALIRGARGRPLRVMFPLVTEPSEFAAARAALLREIDREAALGHALPERLEIGAMLETPSLGFAPKGFFETVDFLSIGGNDLKQFFFAADRENERVRRRYDTLSVSFLGFLDQVIGRCAETGTPLGFCGEDAGRPVEALALAALGLRSLSMRAASIGPVKHLLRGTDLAEARAVIDAARASGAASVRPALTAWLGEQGWHV